MNTISFRHFLTEQEKYGPDSVHFFIESWWNPLATKRTTPVQALDPESITSAVKQTVVDMVKDQGGDTAWSFVPLGNLLSKAFEKGGAFLKKMMYPMPNTPTSYSPDSDKKDYELEVGRRDKAATSAGYTTKLVSGILAAAVFLGGAWVLKQKIETAAEKRGEDRAAVQYKQKIQELEVKAGKIMGGMNPEQQQNVQQLARSIAKDMKVATDNFDNQIKSPVRHKQIENQLPKSVHENPNDWVSFKTSRGLAYAQKQDAQFIKLHGKDKFDFRILLPFTPEGLDSRNQQTFQELPPEIQKIAINQAKIMIGKPFEVVEYTAWDDKKTCYTTNPRPWYYIRFFGKFTDPQDAQGN